jgi:uncharacterized protein YecT (DUF1311 family)
VLPINFSTARAKDTELNTIFTKLLRKLRQPGHLLLQKEQNE